MAAATFGLPEDIGGERNWDYRHTWIRDSSLVFCYDTVEAASDGLHGGEGTFTMCSFWYVECLARSGDVQKPRFLFEKALVNAAYELDQRLTGDSPY